MASYGGPSNPNGRQTRGKVSLIRRMVDGHETTLHQESASANKIPNYFVDIFDVPSPLICRTVNPRSVLQSAQVEGCAAIRSS